MGPVIDIAREIAKSGFMFVKKHGALICTIGSILGVGGTAYYSAKDTKNYIKAKADEEAKLGRPLTKVECLKIGIPEYVRTGLCAGTTIALECGSYGINKNALNIANSSILVLGKHLEMTQNAFKEYRDETLRYLPESEEEHKKFEKIIGSRRSDTPTNELTKPGNIVFSDKNLVLHFKELDTGIEYFKTYNEFESARNKANADINESGFCSLNAFHEYMGVDETEIGWDIGWMQIFDCELDARMIFDEHKQPEIVIFTRFSKCPEIKW